MQDQNQDQTNLVETEGSPQENQDHEAQANKVKMHVGRIIVRNIGFDM